MKFKCNDHVVIDRTKVDATIAEQLKFYNSYHASVKHFCKTTTGRFMYTVQLHLRDDSVLLYDIPEDAMDIYSVEMQKADSAAVYASFSI